MRQERQRAESKANGGIAVVLLLTLAVVSTNADISERLITREVSPAGCTLYIFIILYFPHYCLFALD